jgi:hypothetical protein
LKNIVNVKAQLNLEALFLPPFIPAFLPPFLPSFLPAFLPLAQGADRFKTLHRAGTSLTPPESVKISLCH